MRAQRWWFAGAFAGTVSLFVFAAWAINQNVGTTSGLRRVNAWPDAARWYLLYRERVAPIVPPAGRELSREMPPSAADLAQWQGEPDWYCTFDDGVWHYPDKGSFGARLRPGMRAIVAEDAARKEILVYVDAGDGVTPPVEVAAFRAPELLLDSASDPWTELNPRRVVWSAVLQPESAAPRAADAAEGEPVHLALTEGGGGAMRPASADTSIVLFDIRPDPDGMRVAIGYPTGFTNGLDLFASDDLNNPLWTLAATNVATGGGNELDWIDESAANRTMRFYAAGDATTDSDGDGLPDARETLALGTSAQSDDSDGDGMPDGWEVANGLDPRINDAGGNPDGDELTNIQEYTAGSDPQAVDVVRSVGGEDVQMELRRVDSLRSKREGYAAFLAVSPPVYYLGAAETSTDHFAAVSIHSFESNRLRQAGSTFAETYSPVLRMYCGAAGLIYRDGSLEEATEEYGGSITWTNARYDGSGTRTVNGTTTSFVWTDYGYDPLGEMGCPPFPDWSTTNLPGFWTETTVDHYVLSAAESTNCQSGGATCPCWRVTTQATVQTRSNEFTTSLLIQCGLYDLTRGNPWAGTNLPWGTQWEWSGSGCSTNPLFRTDAYRDLADDEVDFSVGAVGFRVQVPTRSREWSIPPPRFCSSPPRAQAPRRSSAWSRCCGSAPAPASRSTSTRRARW